MKAELAISNSMADRDFYTALDRCDQWRVRWLDLRDSIFGKKEVVDLSDEEAIKAAQLLAQRNISVICLSTVLFHGDVALGEAAFRETDLAGVKRLIEISRIFKPRFVRLLAPQMKERGKLPAWLIPMFQEAVDQIADAGFKTTIENEIGNCIFNTPENVLEFYSALNRPGKAYLTWDVQNFWQCGTFPTIEVYRQLKPVIGYYHVKGGQHDGTSLKLKWRTGLADASWPVLEITRELIADGVSPIICLNGPHGSSKPSCDYSTKADLDFLRRELTEIEP